MVLDTCEDRRGRVGGDRSGVDRRHRCLGAAGNRGEPTGRYGQLRNVTEPVVRPVGVEAESRTS